MLFYDHHHAPCNRAINCSLSQVFPVRRPGLALRARRLRPRGGHAEAKPADDDEYALRLGRRGTHLEGVGDPALGKVRDGIKE